jgi:hypothetical protein
MEISGLSAAICKTANAILVAHQPTQSAVQEFCIISALDALLDLAADYGLTDTRRQLRDRMRRIKSGQLVRPIEEVAIS